MIHHLAPTLAFLLVVFPAPADPVTPNVPATPTTRPLLAVRRPCSLAKIADELSRRSNARVTVDAALAPLRVVWSYREPTDLDTALARIGELTDSRVIERPRSADGRRRFLLERKPATPRLETAWRTEAILRTIREILRAADLHERGQLDVGSFSPGLQYFLKMGRIGHCRAVRHLTDASVAQLLRGERVTLPPGAIPDAELERMVREIHSFNDPDEAAPQVQARLDRNLKHARERGVVFVLDLGRRPLLIMWFGNSGSTVCSFGPEELGLPLTRTNPYRLLEAPGQKPPESALPIEFQRRLEADVLLPADARWESAASALARGVGVDLIADAFLCREARQELSEVGATGKEVLAARGTTLAAALDALCRKHEMVWWQKEGVVYCRSRIWAWDAIYEAPDRFLDRWAGTLAAGKPIGVREIEALAALSDGQFRGLETLTGRHIESHGLDTKEALVRHFLEFFRNRTPAEQQRLLGAGLSLPGDRDPVMPYDARRAAPNAPVPTHGLSLGHVVHREPAARPRVARVEMNIYSTRPGQPRIRFPMTVAIPLLPDPFAGK